MNNAEEKLLQQLQSLKDPCPPLEVLAELVEGDLSPEDRVELESHIHSCLSCLNRLNDLRETLYLAEQGENPPSAFVAEARRLLFPQEKKYSVDVAPFGAKLLAALEAAGEKLRDWMTPRFLGELAVASLLVLVANQWLREGPVPDLAPGGGVRSGPLPEPVPLSPPTPGDARRGGGVTEPPPALGGEAERALAKARELGRWEGQATAYRALGQTAKQKGNLKEARELWTAARELYAKAGMTAQQAEMQQWLDGLDQ